MVVESCLKEGMYSRLGADEDLADIVEMFVDEMPDRIETLQSAFDNRDLVSLGRAAHQLKGAAGSYGFDLITPYAACLEKSVMENASEEEILQAVGALIDMCKCMRAGAAD